MALRGIKPDNVEKRLKALFYGSAGVGKTTAALQFPKPYLIDTERGAENSQYVELLNQSGGVIFQTSDFDEMLTEVKALLTEKHGYKTLIIDPLTGIYNDLVDKCAAKLALNSKKGDDGTGFGRHYNEANKRIKNLLQILLRLDMNIIITSHAKPIYSEKMEIIGNTFDCYKKLDYLFDLVVEIQKRGNDRYAAIKKSRIKTMQEGDAFEFSYQEMSKRYGKDILEKDVNSENLASKEQIADLKRMVEIMKIPEEQQQRWLDKANASSFDEMNADIIQKLIDHLKSKIEGNE